MWLAQHVGFIGQELVKYKMKMLQIHCIEACIELSCIQLRLYRMLRGKKKGHGIYSGFFLVFSWNTASGGGHNCLEDT